MGLLTFVTLRTLTVGLLFTIATAVAAPDQAMTHTAPSMLWGDTTRLGRPFAKDPCVVKFGGRYLLYYSLPPTDDKTVPPGWAVGISESHDLTHWRKISEILPGAAAEAKGLAAPGAIVLHGKVHLFYQTYGNGPKDAICHAISDDGIHFTRDPSNPIFHPTGNWTNGRGIDADVIAHDGKLFLFYATRDPAGKVQMVGVATAPLASDFSRATWTQQGTGPALKPELPWEKQCIEAPSLCHHDGKLYLFYAGAYNNEPQQIGCAVSDDGVHWQRLSNEPLLPNGPPGSWNSSESGHPGIFTDTDGGTTLFYQGNNDHGHTWLLSSVRIAWRDGKPVVQH